MNRRGEPRCAVCGHFLNDDGCGDWICSKRGGCGSEWHHETLFPPTPESTECSTPDCGRTPRDGLATCCVSCVTSIPGVHLSYCDVRHGVPRQSTEQVKP